MTFYTFMMRNHRGRHTPEGDLARKIYLDREDFPRNGKGKFDGWHRILRDYLESQDADSKYLNLFENCWKDYVRNEKKAKYGCRRVILAPEEDD